MTPAEFRVCLDKLGLSQTAAGRFFGVATLTARRWAAPSENEFAQRIPEAIAKLLRYMIATKKTVEDINRGAAKYRYRPRP